MAKYNYDKSVLKGLGVSAFLNEVKVRKQHIAKGENTIPNSIYNPNVLARKLHPSYQLGVITNVKDEPGAKTYTIKPDTEKGFKELAYFKAGQYISFALEFDGAYMCKPYSISSSPLKAKGDDNNEYTFTIKENKDGYASKYILENWKVGTSVTMSGPLGQFTYERLRDCKNVVALAGGSGITPFVSMANAIADGINDYNLTILYGCKDSKNIILKDELEEASKKSNGKVKVVYVFSEEKVEGHEYGFIDEKIIRKYAPDDYSIFVCGPKAMYKFVKDEIAKLNLPRRKVRFELAGEYGDPTSDEAYPKDKADKEFNIKVLVRGETQIVKCQSAETLLHAMETAGIHVPSDCRSGQCGWCHSRLINGEVYIPESHDGRRAADKKFNWIHPCVTYPLSDIEIEVFPIH